MVPMKGCLAVGVALCLLLPGAGASAAKSLGASFGPKNCVTLTRSSAGSCVISTDCEGADTSQTEFAFNCIGKSIVRHSFGVGGFEANEEFDTDVKCDRCSVASATPEAKPVSLKAHSEPEEKKKEKDEEKEKETEKEKEAKDEKKTEKEKDEKKEKDEGKAKKEENEKEDKKEKGEKEEKKEKKEKEEKKEKDEKKEKKEKAPAAVSTASKVGSVFSKVPSLWPWTKKKASKPDSVKYGPKGCVSVYKNKDGHCIMETACKNVNMDNYQYGLVCVDKAGSPVKHLFGQDSFDEKEIFDTLIKCEQCLGLEDIPDAVTLAGEVATMAKDITSLNAMVKNISINVNMLNAKVFPPATAGQAPASAPAAAEAASPAPAKKQKNNKKKAKGLLTHHQHLRKHHLRHSHKRHHHHRRHYDDDDADDEDDENERVKERQEEAAKKMEASSDNKDDDDDEDED